MKKVRRSHLTLVGIFFLVLALGMLTVTSRAIAAQKKYTIKLASLMAPVHPHPRTFVFFAEKVKEYTDGQVEIQVFPSGQLGRTNEVVMGLQMGNIQMGKAALSFVTQFVPEVKIFDLPYLFNDREHMLKVLDGPVGKKFLNEIFPKYGLTGLFFLDDGIRHVYAKKPVRNPSDLKGLKIRVMTSDVMVDGINAMGGIATPTAWPEIYTAIEQGTIDGAENSPNVLWSSKHYEVAPVFSLTAQFGCVTTLFASKKFWDTLPANLQLEIRKAADVANQYGRYVYLVEQNKAFDRLEAAGVKVIRDVDVAAFKARVKPVYDKFVKKYGSEMLDQILAVKE
jgi:tripartite ATP-independent transporter DctP family solute receptor